MEVSITRRRGPSRRELAREVDRLRAEIAAVRARTEAFSRALCLVFEYAGREAPADLREQPADRHLRAVP
jgi:hypothetical protein